MERYLACEAGGRPLERCLACEAEGVATTERCLACEAEGSPPRGPPFPHPRIKK
jgi:hypothetical protein